MRAKFSNYISGGGWGEGGGVSVVVMRFAVLIYTEEEVNHLDTVINNPIIIHI